MLESNLEQSVRKYVARCGGKAYKWVSPGNPGVPDRICLFPGGRVVFVELKKPGVKDGRSERQKKVMAFLQRLGFEVWLINDRQEFILTSSLSEYFVANIIIPARAYEDEEKTKPVAFSMDNVTLMLWALEEVA